LNEGTPEQADYLGLVGYLFFESGIGLELALKTEYVGFYSVRSKHRQHQSSSSINDNQSNNTNFLRAL
jgi:hypothetical protein